MKAALTELGEVLDEVSWAWLSDNHPELAGAVERAVQNEVSPEEIRRFVMQHTRRHELALRCEQAARYIKK